MATLLDLTIAIPVKNEEENLPGCLEAIGNNFAKKIVIIDSCSIDSTKEIALNHGAEIVNFQWDGKFPKKRNWFLRNYNIKTKWILFLDADEYLTEEFKYETRKKLSEEKKCGYWLSYSIHFMGEKLKGGYPLKKLALFQIGAGEYEKIEEEEWSILDMEIHEHPVLNGQVGSIKSKIDHRDFMNIYKYINKQNEYAKWEAKRFLNLNRKTYHQMTFNQKLKYKLMDTSLIGPLFFIGSYVFLGGFRDGAKGITFAIFKMSYFNQIHCIIQELKKSGKFKKPIPA